MSASEVVIDRPVNIAELARRADLTVIAVHRMAAAGLVVAGAPRGPRNPRMIAPEEANRVCLAARVAKRTGLPIAIVLQPNATILDDGRVSFSPLDSGERVSA